MFEHICSQVQLEKKQEGYRYDVKEGFDRLPSEAGERPPFFLLASDSKYYKKDSEGIGDSDAPWFSNVM